MCRFSDVLSIHASNNFGDLFLDLFIAHSLQTISLVLGHGNKEDIGGAILWSEGIEVLPCANDKI